MGISGGGPGAVPASMRQRPAGSGARGVSRRVARRVSRGLRAPARQRAASGRLGHLLEQPLEDPRFQSSCASRLPINRCWITEVQGSRAHDESDWQ
jgi:hypothetical protein